jgi:hypothetical protein
MRTVDYEIIAGCYDEIDNMTRVLFCESRLKSMK